MSDPFIHKSAYVDQGAHIGLGTRVWHFCHVYAGAQIGKNCVLGQNVSVAGQVVIGDNAKIQNNVSVFDGTIIEDDVFLGPSCVLTNISNPRAQIVRHGLYEETRICRGATIGANATVVCGSVIGRYAFVAAGAVVTGNVPDYAFMRGVPAKQDGWMSRHGHRLRRRDEDGFFLCPESGLRYREMEAGRLRCIDLDEEAPLPEELARAEKGYQDFKEKQR